jgi:hypothetical protein
MNILKTILIERYENSSFSLSIFEWKTLYVSVQFSLGTSYLCKEKDNID